MSINNEILVIGLGNSGGNIISEFWYNNREIPCSYLDCDKLSLDKNNLPNKILIGEEVTNSSGCNGNIIIGKQVLEESKNRIYQLLNDKDKIVMVGGLGGGLGGNIGALVNYLLDWNKKVFVIVTMPFEFEEKIRSTKAEISLGKIKAFTSSVLAISLNPILKLKSSIQNIEVFKISDRIVSGIIKNVIENFK